MIDVIATREVLLLTTEFFDAGAGAGNLSYGKDHKKPKTNCKWLTPEQNTRNENAVAVGKVLFEDRKDAIVKTADNYHDIFYLEGERRHKAQIRRGNCGEMAVVANYIAVAQCGFQKSDVECKTINASSHVKGKEQKFGHSFLVLKDKWVVDPWTDVCCAKEIYPTVLAEKMDEWAATNMRVLYMSHKTAIWGTPKDQVIQNFIDESKNL